MLGSGLGLCTHALSHLRNHPLTHSLTRLLISPPPYLLQLVACAFELCLSLLRDSHLAPLLPAADHRRLHRLAAAVRAAAEASADTNARACGAAAAAAWVPLCPRLGALEDTNPNPNPHPNPHPKPGSRPNPNPMAPPSPSPLITHHSPLDPTLTLTLTLTRRAAAERGVQGDDDLGQVCYLVITPMVCKATTTWARCYHPSRYLVITPTH